MSNEEKVVIWACIVMYGGLSYGIFQLITLFGGLNFLTLVLCIVFTFCIFVIVWGIIKLIKNDT